ncbi:MAG TPA: ABC transporter permease, partial [Opitutaceae bacterium]|nr:ABC transporter permease [Opitutaceae bacterium]
LVGRRDAAQWDTVSPPDVKDYAQLTDVFAGVIGSQVTPASLTVNGEPQWIYGQIATVNFFDVLGVRPLLGRTFLPEDGTKPGGNPVVVISEGLWQRRFGGDHAVIGRLVELNRHSFTIVGVVPGEFRGTMSGLIGDFWAPITMHQEVANFGSLESRGDRWLHTQARLQSGVSLARAQAAMDARAGQLAQAYPEDRGVGLAVLPFYQAPYGGQALMLPALRVLFAMGLLVLLIVAANMGNLQLARATARQRETAVRLAIGAARARLVRQWLTESVLLALMGGGLGLLFAMWAESLFSFFLPETPLPVGYGSGLDARTLGYVLGLTLATGLAFGMAPALHAARASLSDALKEGGRSGASGGMAQRLRSSLVVAEVALALLLLAGAGLCLVGIRRARQIDPGFDPRPTLVAGLRIGMNGYDEPRGLVFYRQLRARLAQAPGVQAAALASYFPLGLEGVPSLWVDIEGYTRAPNEYMDVSYSIVSPQYFAAMGIPLRAGRDFTDRDDARAAGAVIVNETMAQRFWPGQDPIGRRLTFWGGQKKAEVVGVVKDGKYRSLNEPPRCFMYLPYQQGVWDLNLGVVLRTGGDPRALLPALRREVRALDPGVALWAVLPMKEYIQAAYLVSRMATILLTGLGVIALLLAAMGLYGVMAYNVNQRTMEIGVRMALGARPGDVVRMVVGQGLRLVLYGLAIGLAGAWFAGNALAHFLPGVSAYDPVTIAAVTLLLTGVALFASWLPARRAARTDPMVALRAE